MTSGAGAGWDSGLPGGGSPERGSFQAGFLWFDTLPITTGSAYPALQLDLSLPLPSQLPPPPLLPTSLPLLTSLPLAQPSVLVPVQQQQQQEQEEQEEQPAKRGKKGGGRKGGSGRSASAAAEEERRARNRATQARFRERQKAKNEHLLEEHAETEAELGRSRDAQEALAAENAALQKMLFVKDAAIASLAGVNSTSPPAGGSGQQQQQQQRQQGAAAPPLLLQNPAGAAASGGAAAGGGVQRQPSGSELGALPLSSAVTQEMERMSMHMTAAHMAQLDLPATVHPDEAMAVAHAQLAADHSCTSLQLYEIGSGSGQASEVEAVSAATPTGQQQQQQQQQQEVDSCSGNKHSLAALLKDHPELLENVLRTSPKEFKAGWFKHAQAFKEILESHDVTQSEAELERILEIFKDWGIRMSLTLYAKPENAQVLFATTSDAPPHLWERVAGSLVPTHAQRTMLQHLWHGYASRVLSIRAERAAAVQAVQHAARDAVTPASLPASTLGGLMNQYLSLFDAAGRLSTLRDAEFVAMLQLMGRTGAVFSPVQKARIAASSLPYFPDVVQLVRLLAQEGEEQHALRHQQQQQQQAASQQQRQQASSGSESCEQPAERVWSPPHLP